MMKRSFGILIVLLSILLSAESSPAGSPFSSRGIGIAHYYPSGRAAGMGGVSIAVADPLVLNLLNPAAVYNLRDTRIAANLIFEDVRTKTIGRNFPSTYLNFNGGVFAVPLKRNVGLAIGLVPLTAMNFDFSLKKTLHNEDYTKNLKGKGGLNSAFFEVAVGLWNRLAVGVSSNFVFGKMEETWLVDYRNKNFRDSMDKFSTTVWGWNLTAGVIYKIAKGLNLGAIFSSAANLHSKTESTYSLPQRREIERRMITYPQSWGVGVSYNIRNRFLVGLDYFAQAWSKFKVGGEKFPQLDDSYRISFGGEITPSTDRFAPYFKKVAYRIGAHFGSLYFRDFNGGKMTEHFITMGIGFPYSAGQLNLALEVGKRGSLERNPMAENILRVSISIAGGEKWFVRGEKP